MMPVPLLEVRGLEVVADRRGPSIPLVSGVSLAVARSSIVALVGESGSGKTLTALALLGLLPAGIRRLGGQVLWAGFGEEQRDLASMKTGEVRAYLGNELGMVFQEASTSLDPTMRAGKQIAEGLRFRRGLRRPEAAAKALALLERVGIRDPRAAARSFPHQLSGGERQRVLIAAAVAQRPKLLIADEPTTALDVTIQASILRLLKDLQEHEGLAILLISHDLGVVAAVADVVVVLYAGRVVESAPARVLYRMPRHPYTRLLIEAAHGQGSEKDLPVVVPLPGARPLGCAFHPRCPYSEPRCLEETPPLLEVRPAHRVACWPGSEGPLEGRKE